MKNLLSTALASLCLLAGSHTAFATANTSKAQPTMEVAKAKGAKALTQGRRYQLLFGADLDVIGALKIAPDIAISSQPARSQLPANYPATLEAQISYIDANEIASVQFFDNGQLLPGTVDSNYRLSYTWPSGTVGAHSLTAKITDTDGNHVTSAPLALSVFSSSVLGQIDGVLSDASGRYVGGWACSQGVDASVPVALHFGASAATSTPALDGTANLSSEPAVAAACGAQGNAYRFRFPISQAQYTQFSGQSLHVKASSLTSGPAVWLSGSGQWKINEIPVVTSLTAPAPSNGSVYTPGQSVRLVAQASDSDGSISRVDFLVDGVLKQSVNGPLAEYVYQWPAVNGSHLLSAVAFDDRGVQSAARTLNVTVGTPPTVTLTSPAAGSNTSRFSDEQIVLASNASDSDGIIQHVEFTVNGSRVGNLDYSAPYQVNWQGMGNGTYTVRAKATDNNNLTSESAATVTISTRPTLTITSPTATSFPSGTTVTFSVAVTGGINAVQLLDNGNALPVSVSGNTYSAVWKPSDGSHTLTANGQANGVNYTQSLTISVIPSVTYIHTDALGSVVAVTDANRNVLERREWEPYGHQLTPAMTNGPGYTGHVMDAATGLIYMQQRYYDPQVGRFLSMDPVASDTATAWNFNRYAYAANNPYKFTDPDGRAAIITTRVDGSVQIEIPITFKGAGANAANISQVSTDISNRWSGTYNVGGSSTKVDVKVTPVTSSTPAELVNTIELTNGPTSSVSAQGVSYVRGGNSGEWNVTSPGMAQGEAAHEAGHLMGAKDHYATSTDAAGNRVTAADPAFAGSLMGTLGPTARPNDASMGEVMSNPSNKHVKETK